MKTVEQYEYQLPVHLLPALINFDYSGFEDTPVLPNGETDLDCITDFLKRLEKLRIAHKADYYTVVAPEDIDNVKYFSRTNCLYNLGDDVVLITVNFLA